MNRKELEQRWPGDKDLGEILEETKAVGRYTRVAHALAVALVRERRATKDLRAHLSRCQARIVKQRAHLKTIEECRVFELETEALLVSCLAEARQRLEEGIPSLASGVIVNALFEHGTRKGPRPEVQP